MTADATMVATVPAGHIHKAGHKDGEHHDDGGRARDGENGHRKT